jgi:hypothetical protein
MAYLGTQPALGYLLAETPLSVAAGGTSAATIIGAKTALGVISAQNDGTVIESGTTAQRGAPTQYKIRFNIDTSKYEGANGAAWTSIGGGDGNDFTQNNLTVAAGTGRSLVGPITLTGIMTISGRLVVL